MLDEALFMQARIFRMFRQRYGLTPSQANELFDRQDVWGFLSGCYDSLHLEGDEAVLEEVIEKLQRQGALAWV